MTDWELVYRELYALAANATSIEWAWANQDAPQPQRPFGILNIISGPTRINSLDERRYDDVCQTFQTIAMREITVSFQIDNNMTEDDSRPMSPDCLARAYLEKIMLSLNLTAVKARLATAGLSVLEELSIQNLDLEIADTMVSRSSMDIRFMLASVIMDEELGGEPTGVISNIVVTSDIDDASSGIQFDEEQIGPVP